ADGLFFGNPKLFGVQAYGAFATIIYSMVVTFIILKVIDAVVGLRVDAEAEVRGLDLAEHSEAGYTI
ncbi:MAG: ammonium transporter, partial [Deltaproteobacteria bacterium]|nr:ammonium transporter [Deltaproteobacteria bacterium]